MAVDHDAWIARVRDAFESARRDGDPVLAEVFPFQIRLGARLHDARLARRRLVWAVTSEQAWLLSRVGLVVVAIAWLMLGWQTGVLLAALGIVPLVWLWRRRSLARADEVAGWLEAAEVVPGAVISAHAALDRPGPEAAPVRFLVSFDPALAGNPEALVAAARACATLPGRGTGGPGAAELRSWLEQSETAQRFDRAAVPAAICGAPHTFAIGAVVYRHQLPGGRLDRAIYPLALRREVDEPADVLPARLWAPEEARTAHPNDPTQALR
jgi:hypothetical protein